MKKHLVWMASLALGFGLVGCDVEQTEEGELPNVDVQAEGGNLPEYEADAAEVDVTTEEKTVEVPQFEYEEPDAEAEAQAEAAEEPQG